VSVKTSCSGLSVGESNCEIWVIVPGIASRVGWMNLLGMSLNLSNQSIPMIWMKRLRLTKFGMTTLGLSRRLNVV
jgi:precorrin-2 methylase